MISPSPGTNTQVQKIVISEEMAGQRVDNFLFTFLKGVPKTRIYRLIRKGEVRVNQKRVKPDYKLAPQDLLRIPPVRREESTTSAPLILNKNLANKLSSEILYEDDALFIINKPAGIAVHGGSGVSFGVIEALRHIWGKHKNLELVHRLDRDTSGCLMIAKRRSALKAIHTLLREGAVEKVYWALVKGAWQGGDAVAVPLKKNQLNSGERVVKVSKDGQAALTKFRILKKYRALTLVEARPVTGRTHQIRVHAAHVGNPIVGDVKYGDNTFNKEMKQKGFNRLFLHAKEITFKLPDYEKALTVMAPLELSLQNALKGLVED